MRRAVFALALLALMLAAANVAGVHPPRSCSGIPGEGDPLDNPDAYVCDVTMYDLVVFGGALILAPVALVVALAAMLRRCGSSRGTSPGA